MLAVHFYASESAWTFSELPRTLPSLRIEDALSGSDGVHFTIAGCQFDTRVLRLSTRTPANLSTSNVPTLFSTLFGGSQPWLRKYSAMAWFWSRLPQTGDITAEVTTAAKSRDLLGLVPSLPRRLTYNIDRNRRDGIGASAWHQPPQSRVLAGAESGTLELSTSFPMTLAAPILTRSRV